MNNKWIDYQHLHEIVTREQQPRLVFMQRAMSVKEYSYCDHPNQRKAMEDGYFVVDNILNDGGKSLLFGVLDGHNGTQVRDFVMQNFQNNFVHLYKQNPKNIHSVLEGTFSIVNIYKQIQKQLDQYNFAQESGTTATIVFIHIQDAQKVIYTANIGDCKAALFSEDGFTVTSENHRLDNVKEKERLEQIGTDTEYDRVQGILQVTRSFGDNLLKPYGVLSRPFISKNKIRLIHKLVVVGTDGLWDYEVQVLIKNFSTTGEMTQALVKKAVQNGSKDNVAVFITKI